MKNKVTAAFFILFLTIICNSILFSQGNTDRATDEKLVKQAALDYIEGYYSGDAARMEKAIHPDINKVTPRDIPRSGRTILNYTTYSTLMEATREKVGVLADSARHIEVKILDLENDVANVKVVSANFTDYLQLLKLGDQWKILNVLFTSGINTPKRIQNFNAETERSAVQQAIMDYLNGLSSADAAHLELALSPEFSKISIVPVGAGNKPAIRRQRFETFIENSLTGNGKVDEIYKDWSFSIIDMEDGIAVVKCTLITSTEFIQVYKGKDRWKILNCILKPNQNLTLTEAMTVTAGNKMPDFTLPVYGGGEFKLSNYSGKNVMLIFPRGWVGNSWCSYCPYQYLELEQMQKESDIEKKYNLKIAFVMPYSSGQIKDWMAKFPEGIQVIENTKNPPTPAPQGSIQEQYTEWARKAFPLQFNSKADDKHDVIPVLLDEKHTLSKQLKIFSHFWDGVSSDQNMASVFIIDKKGVLKLKYIGQMTEDRPSSQYLLDIVNSLK